jgi:cytochrome c556
MTNAAKNRIYLSTIAVLVAIIVAMAYKFIVAGSVERAEDGRLSVALDPAERALMLREMRGFVAGLQGIVDGLARDDMQAVAAASRSMGMARAHDAPVAMMGKLPLEFKTLALGLHREFDVIAVDAEGVTMPKHTLGQLADALQKCVACHSTYRVDGMPAAPRTR